MTCQCKRCKKLFETDDPRFFCPQCEELSIEKLAQMMERKLKKEGMNKILIIDAINYPIVRATFVRPPLEEFTKVYYDYQLEDRDGGKNNLFPRNNTMLLEDVPPEKREVK